MCNTILVSQLCSLISSKVWAMGLLVMEEMILGHVTKLWDIFKDIHYLYLSIFIIT